MKASIKLLVVHLLNVPVLNALFWQLDVSKDIFLIYFREGKGV